MQFKETPFIFDDDRWFCPVVNRLMEQAHRWHNLSLNAGPYQLFTHIPSSLPLLEDIAFVQTPSIHDLAVLVVLPS